MGSGVGRQVDFRGGQKQTQLPRLHGVCRNFGLHFPLDPLSGPWKSSALFLLVFAFETEFLRAQAGLELDV